MPLANLTTAQILSGEDGRKLVVSLTPRMQQREPAAEQARPRQGYEPPRRGNEPPRRGNEPPRLTDIPDVAIEVGEVTTVKFGVSDESLPTVKVAAKSLDETVVPAGGLVLTGSGAERSLKITPKTTDGGEAAVTVTATDAQGLVASKTFVVFVLPILPAAGVAGATYGIPLQGSPWMSGTFSGRGWGDGGAILSGRSARAIGRRLLLSDFLSMRSKRSPIRMHRRGLSIIVKRSRFFHLFRLWRGFLLGRHLCRAVSI